MNRLLPIAVLLSLPLSGFSVNILIFLIGTTPSERYPSEYLAQQLAIRSHRTITVKPILIPEEPKLVSPKLHLVHEKILRNLIPRELHEPLEKVGDDIPWKDDYEAEQHLLPLYGAHNYSCFKILNSDLMDNLRRENIDIAVIYSGNPCLLALVHVLNIPFIYFDTDGFSDESRVASGTPLNFNVPSSRCPYSLYASTFTNRLYNAYCMLNEYLTQYGPDYMGNALSVRHRLLDSPVQRLFNDDSSISANFKPFPSIDEIKQRAELFFINTDPVLEYNVALPPHVIPIGGFHIDDAKPLFKPWSESLKSAPKGVIVVSFGMVANQSKMKLKQLQAILNALKRLREYHIYWSVGPNHQLPNITGNDVPPHISLLSYIPQNDLLAQTHIRLLVTNGGINSILEALNYGIPIVGIPLMGANKHNLNKVVHKGFGVAVQKKQLTEENLYSAIKEVIGNPKYKNRALTVKNFWQKRKSRPLETAIQWIEHAARCSKANLSKNPVPSYWNLLHLANVDIIIISVLFLMSPLLLIRILCHAFSVNIK